MWCCEDGAELQRAWCKAVCAGPKGPARPGLTSLGPGRTGVTGRRARGSSAAWSCPCVELAAASHRQLRSSGGGHWRRTCRNSRSASSPQLHRRSMPRSRPHCSPPWNVQGFTLVRGRAWSCFRAVKAVIPKLARLTHFANTLSGLSLAGASAADDAELLGAI